MQSYYLNSENKYSKIQILDKMKAIFGKKPPVIVCIGTDAVVGDSLGPFVGSILSDKLYGRTYVYGTLDCPVTARDIQFIDIFLKKVHPYDKILAIDAALGANSEIGNVKIIENGIKPGLGVEKNLPSIGNASIIGIVEEKIRGKSLLNTVRVSAIYNQAKVISDGIIAYFNYLDTENKRILQSKTEKIFNYDLIKDIENTKIV